MLTLIAVHLEMQRGAVGWCLLTWFQQKDIGARIIVVLLRNGSWKKKRVNDVVSLTSTPFFFPPTLSAMWGLNTYPDLLESEREQFALRNGKRFVFSYARCNFYKLSVVY